MMSQAGSTVKELVTNAMLASCRYLDDEDFDSWLKLWLESGIYEVETYTPELRRKEILLRLEMPQMVRILQGSSNQVRDGSVKTRVSTPPLVKCGISPETGAEASQRVVIYSTNVRGESSLYALCTYDDNWTHHKGEIKLASRKVTLITRNFSIGTHVVL